MKTFLILSLTLLALDANAAKKVGWRESYGGDATISEFQNIALNIVDTLKENKLSTLDEATLKSLESSVDSAIVACGENLSLNGVVKDAINYPLETPGRIVLNCPNWNTKNYAPANKVRLVAHEYLFLSGVDDSDYKTSSEIVRHFFTYRISSDTNGKFLIGAVRSCDMDLFHQLVEEGANLSFKQQDKMDSLHTAIAYECLDIAEELIDMGVTTTADDISKTNSIALLIQKAANYYLNHQGIAYKRSIQMITKLVNQNPALLEATYTAQPLQGKNDLYILPHTPDLCTDKNMALMVAKGFENTKSYSAPLLSINGPIVYETKHIDPAFINTLAEIGFSLDKADSCGRTAKVFVDSYVPTFESY